MKIKLLQLIVMLSKYAIIGLFLQTLTFTLLLASETNAQENRSVKEVFIDLKVQNVDVTEAFHNIEAQTDFKFNYERKDLKSVKNVSINIKQGSVADILMEISKEANLKFRQVNNNINVNKLTKSNSTEPKIEIIIDGIEITGRVISSDDTDGLPGVNVIVKGTSIGTVTDIGGNYSLEVPDENTILVFSSVGFLKQEIVVGAKSVIDISMEPDVTALDEIVVIGYGTARRKDIAGAVSTVRLEDSPVALASTTNALQSLKGNVAGVNIGEQGSPGTSPSIVIRGQNSINGSNTPLIVLDGIIYLGSINEINPDDITTMDVLKDASAAAIYGSRAANGVIVITTKKGKTEKPNITFNTFFGVNKWQNKFDMMDRDRWTEKYIAQTPTVDSPDDIVFDAAYATSLWAEDDIDTDWYDLVSQNGFVQNYQLAVSGRADRINYYFSGGYNSNEGVVIGDNYQRISSRLKLDADITDWLTVGLDGMFNNNDYSGVRANLGQAYSAAPWAYPYRFAGMPENASANTGTDLERYPTGQSVPNALWGTDGTIDDIDIQNTYRLATYLLFTVPKVDGLTYRFDYSIGTDVTQQDRFTYERYYVGEAASTPYEDRYSSAEYANRLSQANGYNDRVNSYAYVMNNILNYKKQIGDHYIDVVAVATRDYSNYRLISAMGSDYSLNGNTLLGVDGIHKAAVQNINLNVIERANVGYVGRLAYAYKDKYHLTATYRRDGASVFGEDQKWGDFPSLGVAWTMSEENFLSDFEPLNYLKIKASYGKNGNQGLQPYQTLARVASGSDGGIRYEFADAPSTILYGVGQSTLGSPTLGWETTTAFNGGFQSAWLNNRIFLDLDFYFSSTNDQIFSRQIPIMTGFGSIFSSLGQVDNKGIEVSLRTINIDKPDFSWSSELIYWQNRNEIVSLYGDDIDGDGIEDDDIGNNLFIGESLGAIYGYEYIGVVQEDDTEYIENIGAEPGDPMFNDISGPEGVPDGVITADYDRKILGFNKENFRLSFSNTFEYKNFSLYVMLTGIFGGGNDNFYRRSNPLHNSFRDRYDTNEIDHDWWTPENKSEEYLRADAYSNRYLGLQSQGFLKIQDINLSYKLPQGTFSSIGLNSLEVYGSIRNLYTFTNWFGGGDPERGIRPGDNTVPTATTYTMGLKVSF